MLEEAEFRVEFDLTTQTISGENSQPKRVEVFVHFDIMGCELDLRGK